MAAPSPSSYPHDSEFSALLRWHMDIWGTRPDGTMQRSGKPWTIKEFGFAVHGESLKLGSAERNVENWRDAGKGPPNNRTTIQNIETALFGENEDFDHWRQDLRLALAQARAKRAVERRQGNALQPAGFIQQTDDDVAPPTTSAVPERAETYRALWGHVVNFKKSVTYAGRADYDLPPLEQLSPAERDHILSGIPEADRHWISGPHQQGMLEYLWRRNSLDESLSDCQKFDHYAGHNRILWDSAIAEQVDRISILYKDFRSFCSGGMVIDDRFFPYLTEILDTISLLEDSLRQSLLNPKR